MENSKKIITIDEFFSFVEMFKGSEEDQALAAEIYKNAEYKDKDILDRLICKALVFGDRDSFIKGVSMPITISTLYTKNIVALIEPRKAMNIYLDILFKIIKKDE